jgi:hypothetical protein
VARSCRIQHDDALRRADLDLKRQALAQVFPDAVASPPGGLLLIDGFELVAWLRRL